VLDSEHAFLFSLSLSPNLSLSFSLSLFLSLSFSLSLSLFLSLSFSLSLSLSLSRRTHPHRSVLSVYRRSNLHTCKSATLNLPSVPTAATYTLTARNAKKCSGVASGSATISAGVSSGNFLAFFASPSEFYYAASTTVTVYVAGLPSMTGVTVTLSQSGSFSHTFTPLTVTSSQITFNVPAGTLIGGVYDVLVSTSASTCPALIRSGIRVAQSITFTVTSVDPAYIWSGETTSTSVTVSTNGGMVSTPDILMLSRTNSSLPTIYMRSVVFNSASSATAIVPVGTPMGVYDMIVLNPDGGLGVLQNGITIAQAHPPQITSIAPVVYVTGSNTPMTLNGEFFENATATISCDNAPTTSFSITITAQTNTTINMLFPDTSLAVDTFCIITVFNSDGAYARFSGIGIAPTSFNIASFRGPTTTPPTPSLNVGRRGTSTVVGRATSSSKFLYAIGGDLETSIDYVSTATSNLDSVESVNVDIFGHLGTTWNIQRNRLPANCSLGSSAVVGQFLYFSCGHKVGTGVTTDVYRANVLDPNVVPAVGDFSLSFNSSQATVASYSNGLFYYRVSALYGASDDINPNGETLPSELIAIKLPSVSSGSFTSKISWNSVDSAIGYRVYRTSYAGAPPANMSLIYSVSSTASGTFSWNDNGSTSPDGVTVPFAQGALGTWTVSAPIINARAWASLVASNAPNGSNPNDFTFYLTGGVDSTGAGLSTYEYMQLTITPSIGTMRENHTITTAWTAGSTFLSSGRYGLSAAVTYPTDAPGAVPAGSMFMYFGPGRPSTGVAPVSIFDGAWFFPNGTMALQPITSSGSTPTKCGYCMFTYTKNVGAISAGGGATSGNTVNFVTGVLSNTNTNTLSGWNNDPASFTSNRAVSCVKEGAWVYAAGGTSGTAISPFVYYGFI